MGGAKMFDFRRITLFCLKQRFSKQKKDYNFLKSGGNGPFALLLATPMNQNSRQ